MEEINAKKKAITCNDDYFNNPTKKNVNHFITVNVCGKYTCLHYFNSLEIITNSID